MPQPLLPSYLPTCLTSVAGCVVVVGQKALASHSGAFGAGGPIQVGRRDCLGGAGPGLLRGAPGQPYLPLLLRLHLDGLSGALSLAGLPLLGRDCVADLLCSGESQGQVSSFEGCWGVSGDADLGGRGLWHFPFALLPCRSRLSPHRTPPGPPGTLAGC